MCQAGWGHVHGLSSLCPPYDCESVETTDTHHCVQPCVFLGLRPSNLPVKCFTHHTISPTHLVFPLRAVNFSLLPLTMMFSVSSLHGPCAQAHDCYTESLDSEQVWWCIPVISVPGRQNRRTAMSSRPARAAPWILGQLEPDRKTPSQNQDY